MKDSLFDKKFTWLDVVKIAMLVMTGFSTWYIVDLITPNVNLAFVREIAALVFVEGAFLGFEKATQDAKSSKQVEYATNGYIVSLAVIVFFALLAGVLEFGGDALLLQSAGTFIGLDMLARDWVMLFCVLVLGTWIATLGWIYRLYALADPDKINELAEIAVNEEVKTESTSAMKAAMRKAKPVIASARASAKVRDNFTNELNADELDKLVGDVENHLAGVYNLAIPASGLFVRKEVVKENFTNEGESEGKNS